MTTPEERARRRKIAEDKRYVAVIHDRLALIDDWKCPICGNEFSNKHACPHSWGDVEAANDRFLINLKNG